MVPFKTRSRSTPSFFWQGLLILLPVVILAALGALSLRHDRIVAEHEARQRAQEVADTLAPKLWIELVPSGAPPRQGIAFLVNSNGQLLSPPPSSPPSPGALDLSALNSHQLNLWRSATAFENNPAHYTNALDSYNEFVATKPPAAFAALALYSQALVLDKQGNEPEAVEKLRLVVDQYPGSKTETGLPLDVLADFRLWTLHRTNDSSQAAAAVERLCSNVVCRPGPISAEILCQLGEQSSNPDSARKVAVWQRTWKENEAARELFLALQNAGAFTNVHSSPDQGFWCEADQRWWIMRAPDPAGAWYSCRTERDVSTALTEVVKGEKYLPDYFGIGIELAGQRITWPAPDNRAWRYVNYFGRRGGGQRKEYSGESATNLIASAQAPRLGGILNTKVYLTSPDALFAREQARIFWIAALIGCAALAATVGLFTAYRAFHRQLTLSEMKSNFVSSVSHELRAPIASVRLMAESLEQGKIADNFKQQEYFRFIRQECRRLSSLVENVLDFSRIEQGRKQYEFEPTDVAALVNETLKLMRAYAEERGVALQLKLDPSAASQRQPVLDGKAIQQLLINLIDNAIKHSPKAGAVTVGLEFQEAFSALPEEAGSPVVNRQHVISGPVVLLWVEDYGPGIPEGEHQKIFERFYRLGSELRRETQGVGIGLSIVKHVVEAHGGRVLLRSQLGKGSRFTIELPLESGAEANPKSL